MKYKNCKIGQKVVPHSKSVFDYGDLENSHHWGQAKSINQPYLFITKIKEEIIVLSVDKSDGDYFLPEDFEPYIEINNESRNIKMKKSDLHSSMLFKMRDNKLYVLLPDHEEDLVFL